jgi:hypothetical protein
MRTSAVVLALSAAGCFTTTYTSTAGPFVRTIGRDREGLIIERCAIKRFEQTRHNAINFFLNLQPDRELEFKPEGCEGAFISLGAAATPTPPPKEISP